MKMSLKLSPTRKRGRLANLRIDGDAIEDPLSHKFVIYQLGRALTADSE